MVFFTKIGGGGLDWVVCEHPGGNDSVMVSIRSQDATIEFHVGRHTLREAAEVFSDINAALKAIVESKEKENNEQL